MWSICIFGYFDSKGDSGRCWGNYWICNNTTVLSLGMGAFCYLVDMTFSIDRVLYKC